MILSRSLAQVLVVLTLTSVIVPDRPAEAITRIGNISIKVFSTKDKTDRPAEAITRIGNSRTTTFKVSNGKLAKSRVGNGRTIERVQPIRKISGHLVGNGLWSDPRNRLLLGN